MHLTALLHTTKKLTGFDKFVLIVNSMAVAAFLLCCLAPVTDPRAYWFIAFFGLGYQVLLPLQIAFLIYWLIRCRPYMLISGLCLLISAGIFLKYWEFHLSFQPDKKLTSGNIRIMSYNVHDFMQPLNEKCTRTDIANLIRDKQPDVVTIQEYTNTVWDYKFTAAALNNAMRSNNHYFKAFDYTSLDSTGIAIYTKYPQINHGIIRPLNKHQPGVQAIYVDVKCHNKIFRIYTMHLQPTHFEAPEHEYLHTLSHTGKINLHELIIIGNKLKAAFIIRSYQVALIRQHMAKCPYPYVVAGDFNDTPVSYTVNQISKGLKNAFIEKGTGFGITYYGDFPHMQIDYILASRQFNILNYQVIHKRISDHYPLISDMRLD